jgi:hypothetical protein
MARTPAEMGGESYRRTLLEGGRAGFQRTEAEIAYQAIIVEGNLAVTYPPGAFVLPASQQERDMAGSLPGLEKRTGTPDKHGALAFGALSDAQLFGTPRRSSHSSALLRAPHFASLIFYHPATATNRFRKAGKRGARGLVYRRKSRTRS